MGGVDTIVNVAPFLASVDKEIGGSSSSDELEKGNDTKKGNACAIDPITEDNGYNNEHSDQKEIAAVTEKNRLAWSSADTKVVNDVFKDIITEPGMGNCGKIPPLQRLKEALSQYEFMTLGGLPEKQQIAKLRTKILNTRKSLRMSKKT